MKLALFPIARVGLALALLAGLITYVDPARMQAALRHTDPGMLVLSWVLGAVGVAIQWWKWRALSRWLPPPLTAAEVSRSLFGGFALGLISPGRLGELGRALFVAGQRRQVTIMAIIDRTNSALVTLVSGLLALLILLPSWRLPLLLCLTMIGALTYATRQRWWGSWLQRRLAPLPSRGIGSWYWLYLNLLGAVSFNILFFAQFYCLLRAGGVVPLAAILAIPMVFAAKTILPLAPMDLGVREGAAVMVLGHFGVDIALALQASLLLFTINVFTPGVAGWLFVGLRPWRPVPSSLPRIAPNPQVPTT